MTEEEGKKSFKSGFVSIIGRPNAGKSTLLNSILGEKIAIISDKPQTTRNRILGIRNLPDGQIVFLDTPGIHHSRSRLNQSMVKTALSTYKEVDVIAFLIEANTPENDENNFIHRTLERIQKPIFLLINKIDLVPKEELLPIIDRYSQFPSYTQIIPLSALLGDGIDLLLDELLKVLPEGPQLFPEDMITDLSERFLAGEMIREKVFRLTRQEIPYATAVVVEELKRRSTRTWSSSKRPFR